MYSAEICPGVIFGKTLRNIKYWIWKLCFDVCGTACSSSCRGRSTAGDLSSCRRLPLQNVHSTNQLFGSKSLLQYHDMGRQKPGLQYVRIAESPNLQKYTAGELSCRRLSQKVYFNPLMWVNTKLPSHFQIYNCKLSTSTCYKLRPWLMIHLIFFSNQEGSSDHNP